MSTMDAATATPTDWTPTEQDLGPLAWVLDELRKSLQGAVKAMRRFVRDAEVARQSDLASLDAGALRIARQQLHQAGGALEMVGMGQPAQVVRALESAVQRFVQRPELCSDEASAVIERASFALIEYLEHVLAGKAVSPVSLFPQYRQAQVLAGAERVHPADLWPAERRFREPDLQVSAEPLAYGAAARARLDSAVLRIVKSGDVQAAADLRAVALGFTAAQTDRHARAFWKICAGFFDALAHGALEADVYVKRVASRVLMQYASLAKGEPTINDRLVQDLLFFCAQAGALEPSDAPSLAAVRQAFGLARHKPVDYERPRFGLYDPAVLAQARKRIAAATETWSALAGGDRSKLKPATDQFSLVCDSLRKLQPGSESLAQALMQAVEATARSGEPPHPSLAIEVATAVLYLQASFDDMDVAQEEMSERAASLAQRVADVAAGGEPQPLQPWMEDLYRRVSDHQTMGSVVGELRAALAEAEKAMDQYFRNPQDTAVLASVPGGLQQMRGVLSVLGLDQASLAVMRMRTTVERLLTGDVPDDERVQVFEKLGNSLGALGFLIDMLSYQRAMARKLFVYDEEQGELRILMGRVRSRTTDTAQQAEVSLGERKALATPDAGEGAAPAEPEGSRPDAAPVALPEQAEAAAPFAPSGFGVPTVPAAPDASADQDDEEDELLDIFLEEAREVVANGWAAIEVLHNAPGDLSEQTTLRRAFHTLKGSSRMVGLTEFGEAAWAMEQALNAWLAEQKPMQPPLLALSADALQAFGRWANDIQAGQALAWQAQPFIQAADAMRADGAPVALQVPAAAPNTGSLTPEPSAAEVFDAGSLPDFGMPERTAEASPSAEPVAEAPLALEFDAAADEAQPVLDVDLDMAAHAQPEWPAEADETADTAETAEADETDQAGEAGEAMPDFVDTFIEADSDADAPDAAALPASEEIDFSFFQEAMAAAEPVPPSAPTADLAPEPEDTFFLGSSDADTHLSLEPADVSELEAQPELEPATEPESTAEPEPAAQLEAESTTVAEEETVQESVEKISADEMPAPEAQARADEQEVADAAPERAAEAPSESTPPTEAPRPVDETGEAEAGNSAPPSTPVFALDGPAALTPPEDEVKVIGDLRIGIPLYNVYLNEADEWSRRLVTSLQEWELELHQPVPDVAVALAHSLAGSSATVGFSALSQLSRTLEHTLQHLQLLPHGTAEHAQVVTAAAADIRRLLHQFAAGFLKEPNAQVHAQLLELLHTDLASAGAPLESPFSQGSRGAEEDASPPPAPQAEPAFAGFSQHDRDIDAAIAHALASAGDDDDIDVLDTIDPDLFPIFEEEAAELLPRLGGALRQWSARPDNLGARSELLRALHTLKGSARLAGAMRLGEMAHRLESAVEHIAPETAHSADVEPLLARLDALQADFDALRTIGAQSLSEPVTVDVPAAQAAHQQAQAAAVAEGGATPDAAGAAQAAAAAAPAAPRLPVAAVRAAPVVRPGSGQSVRVRAQLLDRLVNQAGEVMIARSRLEARMGQMRGSLGDLTGNLERLRQQLRDIEVQAESQMQSRLALSKDSAAGFDPLEFDRFTRVQELTRMMAESVNDVATVQRNMQRAMEGAEDDLIAQGRQARELQRDLLRTRMVEFEGISERLYAVVRQASKETGKQIKLDIAGGSIEMDRGVLDRMTPVFEHLLRNCVGHGIEAPEARVAAGKPAAGTITIALRQEGNDVSVQFRDDGQGLDVERIRQRAADLGLVAGDAALTPAEAAQLIFLPGFSTASQVTELSGRGIGMDVVRAEVSALGGRIETETEAGQGTAFRLVLPLTTAVTQVVMLRAGSLVFGVPAGLVEIVRRSSAAQLDAAYTGHAFEHGGEQLPFHWAGALLQSSARSAEPTGKSRPVLVLRSAAQRIAVHVDEVLGNQEVVVKNLGPQLSRLPGLAGMSVLASGAVVLIYNPVALATVYGAQMEAGVAAPLLEGAAPADTVAGGGRSEALALAAPPQVPLVLVVDDSITVRRVTQRLLVREGYRVALAADGLQALERLQEERPTVVLSDIEMPRMDGFDLARNIRSDAAMRELPIIMITSRIAQKHREHAMELGVNHYLGKPYSDEELLSLVKHYARQAAAVAQTA